VLQELTYRALAVRRQYDLRPQVQILDPQPPRPTFPSDSDLDHKQTQNAPGTRITSDNLPLSEPNDWPPLRCKLANVCWKDVQIRESMLEAARWAQRHGGWSAANPEQELVKDDA
jgi:hypothetical protein